MGGEGLGRSSEADGVSVMKTADTKRVDWECCAFVAPMFLLTLPTVSEEPQPQHLFKISFQGIAGNCWKRESCNPLQKTVFRVSLLQDTRA